MGFWGIGSRMFTGVAFWNSAEIRISYGRDFLSRNSGGSSEIYHSSLSRNSLYIPKWNSVHLIMWRMRTWIFFTMFVKKVFQLVMPFLTNFNDPQQILFIFVRMNIKSMQNFMPIPNLSLSIRVRNWCVCSGYISVPDACAHERISSWPVCSGYASVPDAYAQHVLKGLRSVHALVHDAYAQCTHQFLTRMLSARISSWLVCSAHASVPDAFTSASVHASIPYAHAEGIQT